MVVGKGVKGVICNPGDMSSNPAHRTGMESSWVNSCQLVDDIFGAFVGLSDGKSY